jgi:hypothetical protein
MIADLRIHEASVLLNFRLCLGAGMYNTYFYEEEPSLHQVLHGERIHDH